MTSGLNVYKKNLHDINDIFLDFLRNTFILFRV